jgi:hypothetical protein
VRQSKSALFVAVAFYGFIDGLHFVVDFRTTESNSERRRIFIWLFQIHLKPRKMQLNRIHKHGRT